MRQNELWLGRLDPGKPLGNLLREARRFRGISQTELARRLSLSGPNLSRIEHGSDLRLSTLLELARALNFEPMLVPKEYVPAVRALLEQLATPHGESPGERPRFD